MTSVMFGETGTRMSGILRGPDAIRLIIPSFEHVLMFFLISRALNQFITSADIKPYAHSDHDCISLAFDFDKIHRGPGFWHFNNELLTDALFEEVLGWLARGISKLS